MVSLPFFLQNTLGHSEVMTGLLLTPWPLATLVTAPLAGYLVERIHPGILGSIGMVLFAIGLFSLSSLTAESSDISIILRLMLMRCRLRIVSDAKQQYNYLFRSYAAFGRGQWDAGNGPPVGTDHRNNIGCLAFQLCHS